MITWIGIRDLIIAAVAALVIFTLAASALINWAIGIFIL